MHLQSDRLAGSDFARKDFCTDYPQNVAPKIHRQTTSTVADSCRGESRPNMQPRHSSRFGWTGKPSGNIHQYPVF